MSSILITGCIFKTLLEFPPKFVYINSMETLNIFERSSGLPVKILELGKSGNMVGKVVVEFLVGPCKAAQRIFSKNELSSNIENGVELTIDKLRKKRIKGKN